MPINGEPKDVNVNLLDMRHLGFVCKWMSAVLQAMKILYQFSAK